MSNNDPWKDAAFASNYNAEANDPNLGWYEHGVNFPSISAMIPLETQTILDFGCGSGDYTSQLAANYEQVEGCDTSDVMLDTAERNHPDISFFAWDFHTTLPAKHVLYDVVIAKLVVQFIEDLDSFAAAISDILSPSGMLLISVPHPSKTASKVADYWQETDYQQQIGTELFDMMVHRSIERYIAAFTTANYVLADLREPQPSREILERYHVNVQDFVIPKRLNLAFRKI